MQNFRHGEGDIWNERDRAEFDKPLDLEDGVSIRLPRINDPPFLAD